jgi:hypothetical protein
VTRTVLSRGRIIRNGNFTGRTGAGRISSPQDFGRRVTRPNVFTPLRSSTLG